MDPRKRPLTAGEETAFQADMATDPAYSDWIQRFYGRFGELPNLNAPEYDTRTAWRYGVKPEPAPDGLLHWPTSVQPPPFARPIDLKAPDHPTMWKQQFMDLYGADPDTVAPAERNQMLAPMASDALRDPLARMFLPNLRL